MPETKLKPELVCPTCKHALDDYAVACPGCQLDLIRNESRTESVLAKSVNRKERSIFFNVSVRKLVIMTILTLGTYEIIWFYKNWCYVNEHTQRPIFPIMNTIFSVFTFYALMKEIERAGKVQGIEFKGNPVLLALVFFALSACGSLPGALCFLGFLPVLTLVPAQRYVNSLNAYSPESLEDSFSVINWVFCIIGSCMLLFILIGTFYPSVK